MVSISLKKYPDLFKITGNFGVTSLSGHEMPIVKQGKNKAICPICYSIMCTSDCPHDESHFPETVDMFLGWKETADARKRKMLWKNLVKFYSKAGLK